MRTIEGENDRIWRVRKEPLNQRGECGVVVGLFAVEEHIRVAHRKVVERHANPSGDGKIHNRLRLLTEGFYDTASHRSQQASQHEAV